MKPTVRSGSFGAPMTGVRPKSSAAAMRRHWRPWFWVLPRKRMLHPRLKQSSVRCAKQQSWSEFTGNKTPCLRVTASASFSTSGRCHPERRSRCFSPISIRMATVSLFSGRTSPSSRRRRGHISAASDKSFARWSFRFPPASAQMVLRTAALPRHGRTAARFSRTTTVARAHRASLTFWQRLLRKQRSGFFQDLRRTADGNVRSAGCRMAVAYFAQSAEPDALRNNKNKQQQGGEEELL